MPEFYPYENRYNKTPDDFPEYRMIIRDFGNGEAEVLAHAVQKPRNEWDWARSNDPKKGEPLPAEFRPNIKLDVKQDETSLERSCRRARQAVRHRIKAQGLDHMLTCTTRENIESVEEFGRIWARFVRLIKAKSGGKDWPYCAVVEKQERGACHIHAAVKGRQDVNKLRGLWWQALGVKVKWRRGVPEVLGSESPGNIDVRSSARAKKWRSRNLASYLSKYITKAMQQVAAGKKRYWAPKGIVIPHEAYYVRARSLLEIKLLVADCYEELTGFWQSPWSSEDWTCILCSS